MACASAAAAPLDRESKWADTSFQKRRDLAGAKRRPLQHSMGGRSLPTRETAPSAVLAAIMPVRQKLRPMSGLERASPRCTMVPDHVRLLYWWHLRAIANDPDRQAGFLRDWAGA